MKGKVAGWQSTLANIRFEESVQCFYESIDYVPEAEIEEIKKMQQLKSLSFPLLL